MAPLLSSPLQDETVAVCTIEKANTTINRLVLEGRLHELVCVVVDEAHMVTDPERGLALEVRVGGHGMGLCMGGNVEGSLWMQRLNGRFLIHKTLFWYFLCRLTVNASFAAVPFKAHDLPQAHSGPASRGAPPPLPRPSCALPGRSGGPG